LDLVLGGLWAAFFRRKNTFQTKFAACIIEIGMNRKKEIVKTSKEAKKAGLKRIERRHFAKEGETRLSDCKVRITINLEADILEYFKDRAAEPNAAPYQTQINNELRRVMKIGKMSVISTADKLLREDNFIEVLKDKLKGA
jgi:uncharacterized protein (DUF4415 family)